MTDITNPYPSWGESGSSPPNGFFYEQGDQVNEKHLDYLWAQADAQTDEFIDAIRQRVNDLHGYLIIDDGLEVTEGSGTREVDVSASVDGAYVNGQYTGGVGSATLTLSSNSSGTTRIDTIWVNENGTIGKSEGTNVATTSQLKLAEVDVSDGGGITDIRQTQRYHTEHIASDEAPDPLDVRPGDLWMDTSNPADANLKVYENGAWRKVINSGYSLTVNAGDGLKGGGSINLDQGSTTLNIEPADFAGEGLEDDGSDNMQVAVGNGLVRGQEVAVNPGDGITFNGGVAVNSTVARRTNFDSETGTVSDPNSVAGGETIAVSFSNTYEHASGSAGGEFVDDGGVSGDQTEDNYVGFAGWITNGSGEITGMNIYHTGINEPGDTIHWNVFGLLA